MKIKFLIVLLCAPLALLCQSIALDSVDVFASRSVANSNIQNIDSAAINHAANENLADLLQKNASIHINSNGFFGQVSSPSVGGLGSDHVKVHWEGIELNQLTLGSFDLSLFPTFLAGNVAINSAADFNTLNTGSLGAGINITSATSSSNSFSLGFGSFAYKRASLKISETIKNVQISIQPYIIYGENNFEFIEKRPREDLKKRSEHNALQQKGLESKIRFSDKLSSGFWLQSRSKQLPATLNQNKDSKAIQKDENFRTYLRYTPNVHWQLQGDYSNDYLAYRDKIGNEIDYSINSRIGIERYASHARYRTYFGPLKLQAEGQFLQYKVKSTGFSNTINQWRSNEKLSAFYKKNIFFAQLSTKLIGAEGNKWRNTISSALGIQKNNYSISYGIAQRFKLPDFNDLYWAQGGNPNLKNEKGYSQHLLYTLQKKWRYELKATYTELDNKIQWVPGPQYWSPINIGQLRSVSLDAKAERSIKINKTSIDINTFANYTRAQTFNETSDAYNTNQVPYVPAFKLGASGNINWQKNSVFVSTYYTSKRFTDFNNQEIFALSPYLNVDLGISRNLSIGKAPVRLQFDVNNLLNNTKLLALARPNPGRYYRLSVTFDIN